MELNRSQEIVESESELSQTFSQNAIISEGAKVTSHDSSIHVSGGSKDANIPSETNTVPSKCFHHVDAKILVETSRIS